MKDRCPKGRKERTRTTFAAGRTFSSRKCEQYRGKTRMVLKSLKCGREILRTMATHFPKYRHILRGQMNWGVIHKKKKLLEKLLEKLIEKFLGKLLEKASFLGLVNQD